MTLAMDNIGPHLLGRVRKEKDDRDFPLEAWREGATELDLALAAFVKSWRNSDSSKRFAKAVVGAIEGKVPTPPAPPAPPAPAGSKTWGDSDPRLDQGQTPHCCGFGAAQWGNTDDENHADDHWVNADGNALYYLCKIQDGEPQQENGSSVHSVAKVLQGKGRLTAYAWATDTNTVKAFILAHGPVVIGIDWTQDMFTPDANNYIAPTGTLEGGHCLNIVGYLADEDAFVLRNSWGAGWGVNGEVKIKATDLQKLLDGLDPKYPGEAMAAIELAA